MGLLSEDNGWASMIIFSNQCVQRGVLISITSGWWTNFSPKKMIDMTSYPYKHENWC